MLVLSRKTGEAIRASLDGEAVVAHAILNACRRTGKEPHEISISELDAADFSLSCEVRLIESRRNKARLGFANHSGHFIFKRHEIIS